MIYVEQLVEEVEGKLITRFERARGECTDQPGCTFVSYTENEYEIAVYSDGSARVMGVDYDRVSLHARHHEHIFRVNEAFAQHKPT